MKQIEIRPECPKDFGGIRELTVRAFTDSELGYGGEAELIENIRASEPDMLSLVATEADRIVGHILFSDATIETEGKIVKGMGLAPMSVASDRQRRGIGTRLVKIGVDQLFARGCRFVIVFGHPDYYTRFGFEPASNHNISHGFDGATQNHFFIRFNPEFGRFDHRTGLAFYHPAFGSQHDRD